MRKTVTLTLAVLALVLGTALPANANYGKMTKAVYTTIYHGELQDNVELSCACGGHALQSGTSLGGGLWKLTDYTADNSTFDSNTTDIYVYYQKTSSSDPSWQVQPGCSKYKVHPDGTLDCNNT